MIDETDIQQILKKDGFELSDEDFQLFLEIVKSQINQGLDVPIEPVSFTQVENGFNDDKLLVDMFPIDEIHSLKIEDSILIEDKDYNIDYDDGILYFNRTYNGFLRLEYSAGLTTQEYSTHIVPLIINMLEYNLDNNWDKNASSIKEGDITISYDTSIGKGALIQKTLNDLNNRYSTYIRML